jgi:uncharacterized SAM-binding protein YcdF (DUF218 family)
VHPVSRTPAWQRHLRDPDVWQAGAVALSLLVASLGTLWLYHFVRVWRTARAAPHAPLAPGCLLVFGKRLSAGVADADLRARIARAHRLRQDGGTSMLVLLGGAVGDEPSEAAVARDLLRDLGGDERCPLLLEEASGDTLENLRHARALLDARGIAEVTLLSNRYHLARCALLARSIGLAHRLCAAEERWQPAVGTWPTLIKEAGLSLWLDAGIRWARLTGHRRMLSRLR